MTIYFTTKNGTTTRVKGVVTLSIDTKLSVVDAALASGFPKGAISVRLKKPTCVKELEFMAE